MCSWGSNFQLAVLLRRNGCAGPLFSLWSPLLFLFPFTAPLVRPLAAALLDAGFRRILAARRTIKDVAFRLIAAHRALLAQVRVGAQVRRMCAPCVTPSKASASRPPPQQRCCGGCLCWSVSYTVL